MKNYILSVKNGSIDLRTGIFNRKQCIYPCINANYDKNAKAEEIEKFLEEILPGKKKLIYEIIGYCLTNSYYIHKAFLFYGTGANGKSTLVNVIQKLLGLSNVSFYDMFATRSYPFHFVNLQGKMVNFSCDIPKDSLDLKIIETLVRETKLIKESKNKEFSLFKNRCKLLFTCNDLPNERIRNCDGFYPYFCVIEFKKEFPPLKAILRSKLIEKLTTEEEKSGLLNLALKGLKELHIRGKFLEE